MTTGRVAAVDIGTNSVRLLICEATGQTVLRDMHITRLGEGVDVANQLQPAALERTLRVLERYGALIEELGA
jgi:exopolyphosphatase/guanosine-5'-triphosphate,3'-diphosphate pyrophosphatase